MAIQVQHKRNCIAIWRGWSATLFEQVPEDAPCTCGAEERAAAHSRATERRAA